MECAANKTYLHAIEELEATDGVERLALQDLHSALHWEPVGQLPCWHCLRFGEVQSISMRMLIWKQWEKAQVLPSSSSAWVMKLMGDLIGWQEKPQMRASS